MQDVSIVIAGFGGQGILSAGKFIATAALLEGREVSWFPSYGPEMRGGTANCSVVISDLPIGSPVINDADVLIVMNGPSLDRFISHVKPGGLVIVDSSLVLNIPDRKDISLYRIPASTLAVEAGNITFAIIYLLGCLAKQSGCIQRESFEAALTDALPTRHHHLIPKEMAVFDIGGTFLNEN
ncbi:MAG: 2-oxoacid:acceptor oxidoreductase family protein [Eubacteriales bacterium]|nr:2-oxoacid:acceptor oxidoreductase family protein [Eubacteriales bacterium]